MLDYRKLYLRMFSAADAVEELEALHMQTAKQILLQAMREMEELYIEQEDETT